MNPAPSRPVYSILAALALLVASAGCSVFGIRSGTDLVPYEVIGDGGEGLEIRRYGPRVAAEVVQDDGPNAAFRTLAGYIFGDNAASAEIAMTAPVEMDDPSVEIGMTSPVATQPAEGGQVRMRFFLPAEYTLASAPRPADPRIMLREVPARTVAALRFSGLRDEERTSEQQALLLERLSASPWRPTGAPAAFYYDPPWTLPFLRRNEAVVTVEPRGEGQ